MRVRVLVRPKAGILDPQGQAVERALPALGFSGVSNVHVGRLIELDVEDPARVDEMCERLLANLLIEDYEVVGWWARPQIRRGTDGRSPPLRASSVGPVTPSLCPPCVLRSDGDRRAGFHTQPTDAPTSRSECLRFRRSGRQTARRARRRTDDPGAEGRPGRARRRR